MGEVKYLYDTNAVLYELKGISKTIEINDNDSVACSFVTQIELLSYGGISDEEKDIIKTALTHIEILYIDQDVIERSISVRQEHGLKIPDAIICATALCSDTVLVTADKKMLSVAREIGLTSINAL